MFVPRYLEGATAVLALLQVMPCCGHFIVVSTPFSDSGGPSPEYRILTLEGGALGNGTGAATIADTGLTFSMDVASSGPIAITSSWTGFVAQNDGTVGVFFS